MRNKISTLLTLSAAIALLAISPLVISNPLIQPAQAQTTTFTFRTPEAAPGTDPYTQLPDGLTFDIQGTASSSSSSSGSQSASVTNGTFQITDSSSGQTLFSGDFNSGTFTNDTEGGSIVATGSVDQSQGGSSKLSAPCSTLEYNGIEVYISASTNGGPYEFQGPVECSSSQGGGTAQSMTAGTTTTQDSDGDGIPDSSDKCANSSNPRCFKEAT